MKDKTFDNLWEALKENLPYGFLHDKKKGVVIYNREYEALFFKGAKPGEKTLKFNPEEAGFKPLKEGEYKIVPEGTKLKGNQYFLYSGIPRTQEELAAYLIKLSKLFGCFLDHSDINDFRLLLSDKNWS